MPDGNAGPDNVDRGIRWDLETQLAASLPGLSDEDLTDLAARVGEELQDRVGNALSAGLTSGQLEEFEQLIDRGDSSGCDDWLEANRPGYRATVATVRADLVAEVVRTVSSANPAAAQGNRTVAQLLRTAIELAEAHFDGYGLKYTRNGDRLRVMFTDDDGESSTVVWVALAGRHADTFTLTGTAADVGFPPAEQQRLCEFAADWNQRTWQPKAVVLTDEDDGRCQLAGEVAICIGPRVTRAQVDTVLGRGLGSIFAMFADARRILTLADSDGQMTVTETGGSVIGV